MARSVVIIIPCYNEQARLPVKEFTEFLENSPQHVTLFFVDDGSTDGTVRLLEALHKKFPEKAQFHRFTHNKGKAGAIRHAVMKCSDMQADYFGFFDADLATPLSEIDRLLTIAGEYDHPALIMGTRVKLFGNTNISRYASRHYAGRLFATIVSNLLGLPFYDTQCGAKLFRKDAIDLLFKEPFISRWLFDVEMIFRIKNHYGLKAVEKQIVEVPLKEWTEKGNSKISFFYLLTVPAELVSIFLKYRGKVNDGRKKA